MKYPVVRGYHLRAELDAIDGKPQWLDALCDQFLDLWEYLLSDETGHIDTSEYEILTWCAGLASTLDRMETLARIYFDTTPATVETIARVDHAVNYIWRTVQDLYDGGDDVNLLVVF